MVGRSFDYWLTQYRRTWRGTAISTVLEPLGFLAAIGLGLGTSSTTAAGPQIVGGVSYLAFIAPGLLAARSDADGVVRVDLPGAGRRSSGIGTYHAQLATPLRVVDVARRSPAVRR